jgi:hypothetical protein
VAKGRELESWELYVLNRLSRPFTPYCGLKLVELAQRFFPPGVVQALSGRDELGPWMTSHPKIDKISFTGSTATGKRVMQSASATLKRLTLELSVFLKLEPLDDNEIHDTNSSLGEEMTLRLSARA